MPSLLVRDLSDSCKKQLAISAAEHGRSQQAEARAILESALCTKKDSLSTMIRQKALEVGGIDIPIQKRHTPRITGIQL